MKFIEVKNTDNNRILINTAHIIKVYEDREDTAIIIADRRSTTTKTSYDEVLLLIKNAQ